MNLHGGCINVWLECVKAVGERWKLEGHSFSIFDLRFKIL
jgi:hypothetical protein